MEKIWTFIKSHWKLIGAIALLAIAIIIILTNVLPHIFAWIFGIGGGALTGGEITNRRNTVPQEREEKLGERDDKGFVQVPVIEVPKGEIKVDAVPDGVKAKDITSETTITVETKADTTITHSESFFKSRRKQPITESTDSETKSPTISADAKTEPLPETLVSPLKRRPKKDAQ